MSDYWSSSTNEDRALAPHATNNIINRAGGRAATSRNMKSLFMEDELQSKQGVTSLRYEDRGAGSANSKALSNLLVDGESTPGQPHGVPSPLQTATQAVVLAYKGEVSMGPCVVATCVPRTNASINTFPILAIVNREKKPICRLRMDESMQLLQNETETQFASLYDPTLGIHWSLMFKGRRECTEFVAAAHTTLHYLQSESSSMPPFMVWGARSDKNTVLPGAEVSRGDVVLVSLMAWLLRRVPNTRFFSLGKMIEEVPLEAPREIIVGDGAMMDGIEELLVGMCGGEASRLGFLPPKKTRIRRGISNPEVSPSETVVVHITCHEITRCRSAIARGNAGMDDKSEAPVKDLLFTGGERVVAGAQQESSPKPALGPADASATGTGDVSALLHTLLLQALQQQQQKQQQQQIGWNNQGNNNAAPLFGGEGTGQLSTIERGIERVHVQLASLYEKIDRLSIDEKIEKNNAAIEIILKRVIGKAPISDVDLEDMTKDRDGLLATIEHLKRRLDEERNNYHHALESISRLKDDMHRLQNDLQIQHEAHESRVRHLEDQRRLQLVEAEVQHRQALDRIANEKYDVGQKAGYMEGVQVGRNEALVAAGRQSDQEFRDQLLACEKHVVQLETELQEREACHIAERRRLREQINALQDIIARLEKRAVNAAVTSQRGSDSVAQQCKVLDRALNAAYTSIVAQLSALGEDTVPLRDVLQVVLVTCRSEARTFTEEIKKEAMLQFEPLREGTNGIDGEEVVETMDVKEAVGVSGAYLQDGITRTEAPEVESVHPGILPRDASMTVMSVPTVAGALEPLELLNVTDGTDDNRCNKGTMREENLILNLTPPEASHTHEAD